MVVQIRFNSIKVNSQSTNSAVSIGKVMQNGWSSHSKENIGTGSFFGISMVCLPVNFIFDNDIIDAPITDNDKFISPL